MPQSRIIGMNVYTPYLSSIDNGNFAIGALGNRIGFIGVIESSLRDKGTLNLGVRGSEIYKIDGGDPLLEFQADIPERIEQDEGIEPGKLMYDSNKRLWLFRNNVGCEFVTQPRFNQRAIAGLITLLPLARSKGFTDQVEEFLDILKNPKTLV